MTKKIALAIGYPIGFITIKDDDYYSIQLNDKTYPINLLNTYIWLEALNGEHDKITVLDNVVEALYNYGYKLNEHYKVEDLEVGYNTLVETSLIVELDTEEPQSLLDEYSEITPHRVGFGMGMDFDVITIHHEDEEIEINPLEYYIWQMSNGTRTLSQMYDEYEKAYEIASGVTVEETIREVSNKIPSSTLREMFVMSFISLYRNNLIYVSNI